MEFRRLTTADASDIAVLEAEVFPEEAWSMGSIEEELASPWSQYLGAFRSGLLCGYGGVKGDREGDLMTLAVRAEDRRQGLGRSLLHRLVNMASAKGMRLLFLEVRASNVAAQNLYCGFGFESVGTIPNYYRHPAEDAVVMRLRL